MIPKLDEISDPQLFESGVWKSVDKLKAPLWVDGENVNFRRGGVEKCAGWQEIGTSAAALNAVAEATVGGERRIYAGGNGFLDKYVYGSPTPASLRSTGLSSGFWSFVPWGSYLYASNGVDPIQAWLNTGSAASMTADDAPGYARIIRAHNVHLVAFGTDVGEGFIEWSKTGDPAYWTPSLASRAGFLPVRDIASGIMCAEALGSLMAFYSRGEMFILNYLSSGPSAFGYQRVQDANGAAGKNAVASVGRMHYGVEERGFWRSDGSSTAYISEPALWNYYRARIDWSKGDEIVAYHNREKNQVEWHFPTVEPGYEGLAFNYSNNQWAPRSYKLTAAKAGNVFGGPIGAIDEEVVLLDTGSDAGSNALPAFVQTKPLAMQQTDAWKWLEEIRLRQEATGEAFVTVGLQESPDDSIEWLTPVAFAERLHLLRDTVFVTLKFSSTALGASWAVSAFEFFGQMGGSRL